MDPIGDLWTLVVRSATWLEASALGNGMRSMDWAYPAVNLLHLLGLVLLVGPMLLLDLRLLGLGTQFPLPAVSAALTPFAVAGLCISLISGVLLFAADAGPLLVNDMLRIKLLLVALGIVNALIFRRLWTTRLHDWDTLAPRTGLVQAIGSALCWITAASLGRLIAYT